MAPLDPDSVVVKKGAIDDLSDLLRNYRFPLVVTDQFIQSEYSQLMNEVLQREHTWLLVSSYKQGMLPENKTVDVILGFGGGRSLDVI